MSGSPKSIHHSCSKSSPIKPNKLFWFQFDKNLHRLMSSEGASTSTESSISYELNGLINLLSFIDNLCQLTCTKPGATKEQNHKLVEYLLDKSLWLIDVCETIRAILMQTTERARQLQSVLRRKAVGHEVAKEFGSYFKSRKMVKKVLVKKVLKEADSFRKNNVILASSNESQKTINPYICLLHKSYSISADVLKHSFSYIASCSSTPSGTTNKWSLISKLVHLRYELSKDHEESCFKKKNTFKVVDDALHMLTCHKKLTCLNNLQIIYMRRQLEDLESVALDLESSIQCLSRLFIKCRVVLLNVLNQ